MAKEIQYPNNVFAKKMKMALISADKTQADVASALGTVKSNITTRLTRNNFTEDDMRTFAAIAGYELEIRLVNKTTGETI